MQHLIVKQQFKETPNLNHEQKFITTVLGKMPVDMKIAMIAGCVIDAKREGDVMVFKTRFPISILKDADGRVISVVEKRQ